MALELMALGGGQAAEKGSPQLQAAVGRPPQVPQGAQGAAVEAEAAEGAPRCCHLI
jgi:hypothetical protein